MIGRGFTTIRALMVGLVILITAMPSTLFASATTDEIKAAYLYNLTKFISLNKNPGRNYTICLVGGITNSSYYYDLNGKRVNGNTIKVTSVSDSQVRSCQMVYTQTRSSSKIQALANLSTQAGFILVGDGSNFVNEGGMVGLIKQGNNIKFGLNKRQFQQANLKVSAKLYKLAIFVK